MYKNCNAYAVSIELLNLQFSVFFFDAEKAIKPAKDVQNVKDKSAKAVNPSSSFTDAEKFVEEILDRISAKLLSEVCEKIFYVDLSQLVICCTHFKKSVMFSLPLRNYLCRPRKEISRSKGKSSEMK